MTREEALEFIAQSVKSDVDIAKVVDALKTLEQEPRHIESIPYLMHKELNAPISECQKAYDVAINYLRSQAKIKG